MFRHSNLHDLEKYRQTKADPLKLWCVMFTTTQICSVIQGLVHPKAPPSFTPLSCLPVSDIHSNSTSLILPMPLLLSSFFLSCSPLQSRLNEVIVIVCLSHKLLKLRSHVVVRVSDRAIRAQCIWLYNQNPFCSGLLEQQSLALKSFRRYCSLQVEKLKQWQLPMCECEFAHVCRRFHNCVCICVSECVFFCSLLSSCFLLAITLLSRLLSCICVCVKSHSR